MISTTLRYRKQAFMGAKDVAANNATDAYQCHQD